LLSMGFALP